MHTTHHRRLAVLAAALAVGAGGLATAATAGAAPPSSAEPGGGQRVSKVVVVVEENHSTAQMKAGMPYLAHLGRTYAEATHYKALTHPSEPNYLAIAAGSTFGVHDDEDPSANGQAGTSVFGQAVEAGLTSGTYSESMHGTCALSGNIDDGYAVKHNPQAFFTEERTSCKDTNVSDARFTADARASRLPNITFLVPSKRDDAHDGTLADADRYLRSALPAVLGSQDFTSGRLAVVVTADEDDGGAGNRVYTVVLHKDLAGRSVSTPLTHYSLSTMLSRTVGKPPLREARTAPDMAAAFGLDVGPSRGGDKDPAPTPTASTSPTSTPEPTSSSDPTNTPDPTDTVHPLASATTTAASTTTGDASSTKDRTLAWAPPDLAHPIVLTVPRDGQVTSLKDGQDYRLVIKETVRGTLHIVGGDDVVVVGGQIDASGSRAMYLQHQTGTVHVEGVRVVGDDVHEGIDIAEPSSATVQLENLDLGQVNGSYSTHHADLVQTWAGPGRLRVDGLEGRTTYQGFFLAPDQHTSQKGPWSFDLRNVVTRDVSGRSKYHDWFPTGPAFHLSTQHVVAVKPQANGNKSQTVRNHEGAVAVIDSAPSPLSGGPGADYISPGYDS